MQELLGKIKEIHSENLDKIQFTAPKHKQSIYKKAVLVRLKKAWQLQKYTEKQVFHETVQEAILESVICGLLEQEFKQLQAETQKFVYSIRITGKDKILSSRKARKNLVKGSILPVEHNRKKNYLLPEGTVVAPLVDMGIFTTDGNVIHSMYDKYKQINRFVELVNDAIQQHENTEKPFHIVDFGCGKSYLTFILYYYFTNIKKIPVVMTGLDLKKDVVEKCNQAAEKYGYHQLSFQVGDIKGYTPQQKPDMVISLHACDTATDYALFHGVQWEADYIFSVPCCQHELNAQMKTEDLALFTRYGLVQERVSALMTDAVRANLLQACGYKTQLVEFVGFEHTPKNILIRAVKSNLSFSHKAKMVREVQSFAQSFAAEPTFLQLVTPLLKENNLL